MCVYIYIHAGIIIRKKYLNRQLIVMDKCNIKAAVNLRFGELLISPVARHLYIIIPGRVRRFGMEGTRKEEEGWKEF